MPRKTRDATQSSSETQDTQPLLSFPTNSQPRSAPRPPRQPSQQRGANSASAAAGSSFSSGATQSTLPFSQPARSNTPRRRSQLSRNAEATAHWDLYEKEGGMDLSTTQRGRPFMLHVYTRHEAKQPKGTIINTLRYAINIVKHTYPEDGGYFGGNVSPAAAMSKAYEHLRMSYVYSLVVTDIEIEDVHRPRRSSQPRPLADRVLRGGGGGTAVVNDTWSVGQRGYLLEQALEMRVDGECVAAQLLELVHNRDGVRRMKERTPEQAAAHAAGAVYLSFETLKQFFDELYPERTAGGGGMTLRHIAKAAEHFGVHFVAIDERNRVVMNHNYHSSTARAHKNLKSAWVMYAANGHAYFLDSNAAREHVVCSIAQIVYQAAGDDSAAIGRYITRPPCEKGEKQAAAAADEARACHQGAPDPDVIPFDEWEPMVYEETSARVSRLYDLYIERGLNLPDEKMVRKEKQVVREFSYYLDPLTRRDKVTVFSTGSLHRPRLYRPGIAEIFRLLGTSFDQKRFAQDIYARGMGTIVTEAMRAVLDLRKMPSAETKRQVLQDQDDKCYECADDFTTDVFVTRTHPLAKDSKPPCWEHRQPHKAGGMDVSPKNIVAVCLACMKAKDCDEREAGAYTGVENVYTSYFNSAVRTELHAHAGNPDADEWRTLAKMKEYSEDVPVDEATGEVWPTREADVNKCRRFVLVGEARKRWPIFGVCDEIEVYDGNATRPGLYYVRTSDCTRLFHGDGWYTQPLIEYGLLMAVIVQEDIHRMLIAARTLDANYFDSIMRAIEKAIGVAEAYMLGEEKNRDERAHIKLAFKWIRKDLLGNGFVGMCGRKGDDKIYTDHSTLDEEQVDADCAAHADIAVRKHKRVDGSTAYTEQHVKRLQTPGSRFIIYQSVLELERILLDEMEQRVLAAGGVLLYAKTDAVGYALPPDAPDIDWLEDTYEHVKPFPDSHLHPRNGRALKFKLEEFGAQQALSILNSPVAHGNSCGIIGDGHRTPVWLVITEYTFQTYFHSCLA